jgi:transcriptional regulator with XRE-family HTH domain
MPRPSFRTDLGPAQNEAARLLWLRMAKRGLSMRQAGAVLGVSSGLVSRWLFCDGKPGLVLAEKVRVHFKIPISAWNAPPSEPIELPTARTGTEG